MGGRLSQCVATGGSLQANLERVAAETEQLTRQATRADAAALYLLDAHTRSMTTLTPQHGFAAREHFPIWLSSAAETVASGTPWSAVRGRPPPPHEQRASFMLPMATYAVICGPHNGHRAPPRSPLNTQPPPPHDSQPHEIRAHTAARMCLSRSPTRRSPRVRPVRTACSLSPQLPARFRSLGDGVQLQGALGCSWRNGAVGCAPPSRPAAAPATSGALMLRVAHTQVLPGLSLKAAERRREACSGARITSVAVAPLFAAPSIAGLLQRHARAAIDEQAHSLQDSAAVAPVRPPPPRPC